MSRVLGQTTVVVDVATGPATCNIWPLCSTRCNMLIGDHKACCCRLCCCCCCLCKSEQAGVKVRGGKWHCPTAINCCELLVTLLRLLLLLHHLCMVTWVCVRACRCWPRQTAAAICCRLCQLQQLLVVAATAASTSFEHPMVPVAAAAVAAAKTVICSLAQPARLAQLAALS